MPDSPPPPDRWPGGARCAVLVTVDLDAELPLLAARPDAARRVKTLSVGTYGTTRGVHRLLGAFAELDVPSTWFVPGRHAENHPGLLREIAAAGHEIAHHGHAHEDFDRLDLAGQLAVVDRGSDALAAASGRRPTGFRVPDGELAPGLPAALLDRGFTWSSSLPGDDLPYLHPGHPGHPGPGRRLVEIPVHHELTDHPYFFFNLDPPFPVGQSRIASYREVLANWTTEFTAHHRYGLCYVLRLHPEVSGTPGRIGLVRELLQRIRSHGDVWLTTGGSLAAWWSAHHPRNAPGHPADLFARLTAAPGR